MPNAADPLAELVPDEQRILTALERAEEAAAFLRKLLRRSRSRFDEKPTPEQCARLRQVLAEGAGCGR